MGPRTALFTAFRIVIAVVAVAAVIGGTYALAASGVQPDFSLAGTPSSQTVNAGGSTTFSIGVTRTNGFSSAVSLSAAGLPAGTAASFNPSAPASSQAASTMTVTTSSATPAGTYKVTVTGAGQGRSHTADVTLVVQPAPQPNFTISAVPASQVALVGGDDVTYDISIARTGGFSGPVTLSQSGVPDKTDAVFAPATIPAGQTTGRLTVTTTDKTKNGVYSIVISGQNGSLIRTAGVSLSVEPSAEFTISGNADAGRLFPGAIRPVDPLVANPNKKALDLSAIQVALQSVSKAGCATTNFQLAQPAASAYPIRLGASAAAQPLSSLIQASHPTWSVAQVQSAMPTIKMLNAASNQDACKNTTLSFKYTGSGGMAK
jgi:hypothetical protein